MLMQHESRNSAGQPSGQRQHKPIVIHKEVDSASPLILSTCCNSEILSTVEINLTRPDSKGGETVYQTIHLTNASISGYKIFHGIVSPPKPQPKHRGYTVRTNELEEFELVFEQITFTNVKNSKSMTDDWLAA
jgi:type VI secretion system secreted protein Hcp